MERMLKWLPKPQPLWIRALSTTAIMAVAMAAQFSLSGFTGIATLYLLLVGVLLCAILFGRGAGFYATALASLAAYAAYMRATDVIGPAAGVAVFVLFALMIAVFGDGIRKALERALAAEAHGNMLLQELHHRTQNTLAVITALLELQARSSPHAEVVDALTAAAARVRLQADAYRHLRLRERGMVEVHEYLRHICEVAEKTVRGVRPIRIRCQSEETLIDAQKALALGLIVNELITNALKYAFSDNGQGVIEVTLVRDGNGHLRLSVVDDGHGCPDGAPPGLGSRLITALARQYGGSYQRRSHGKGCEAVVTLAPPQRTRLAA